ncbi:transcriptional regulator CynR [Streptomyces albipurpureus]|uniref:Transcriptional regulator CynR n=1 Tax=Streptomyces albipurpureus TaxID=2897419 RepID=A0ABT0URD5_9ACTN|nr:transcriptional regulator CynR [Streptomyces sp. CWNU-1]MCM2390549.1 transcriptional regulator CynR [Streptomyces sp. CWNU-1]
MSPELRHLRYLLAVAEHASFTRAAEELHISQPTLSQQIRQLEKTLGVQLLDRTGRTVRLTDAGETYLAYARRALRDLAAGERAIVDVQDLTRGQLRLAMTPTFTAYLIGPLVAEFHTLHPTLTIKVQEMTQDRIEAALLRDEIDLGIAFGTTHLAGVEGSALFTEELSVVIGSGHPYSGHTRPLPAEELTDQPLALLSGDFATRGHIDAYFATQRAEPLVAVEANSISALTEIVQRTSLATVLPHAITQSHPDLHPIPLTPTLPARTVSLLRRESAYTSAASRAFTRLAHRWAREHSRAQEVPAGAGKGGEPPTGTARQEA